MKGNRANQIHIFYRNQNETHVIFQIIKDRLSSKVPTSLQFLIWCESRVVAKSEIYQRRVEKHESESQQGQAHCSSNPRWGAEGGGVQWRNGQQLMHGGSVNVDGGRASLESCWRLSVMRGKGGSWCICYAD